MPVHILPAAHKIDKLDGIISAMLTRACDGESIRKSSFPEWFIPTIEKDSCKLLEKILSVIEKIQDTSVEQATRNRIKSVITAFSNLSMVCRDPTTAELIKSVRWNEPPWDALSEFFKWLYPGALEYSVFKENSRLQKSPTHQWYEKYVALNGRVCRICGLLSLPNPRGRVRADMDHYLSQEHYPMASVNTGNLIPACHECNQTYKGSKDILSQHPVPHPYYDNLDYSLAITCLREPTGDDLGEWQVQIISSSDEELRKARKIDWAYSIAKRSKNEISTNWRHWIEFILSMRNDTREGIINSIENGIRVYSGENCVKNTPGCRVIRSFLQFAHGELRKSYLSAYDPVVQDEIRKNAARQQFESGHAG